MGGADNEVRVFDTLEDKQLCLFPQAFLVYSVRLSRDGALAFCSGKMATVYGVGSHWNAKPAFNVVKRLFNHPQAVQLLFEAHPSLINYYDQGRGRSCLTEVTAPFAESEVVAMLAISHTLKQAIPVRLFPERQLTALLDMSTQTTDAKLVKLLLECSLRAPGEVRSHMAEYIALLANPACFPELVSNFLKSQPLTKTKYTLQPVIVRRDDRKKGKVLTRSLTRSFSTFRLKRVKNGFETTAKRIENLISRRAWFMSMNGRTKGKDRAQREHFITTTGVCTVLVGRSFAWWRWPGQLQCREQLC